MSGSKWLAREGPAPKVGRGDGYTARRARCLRYPSRRSRTRETDLYRACANVWDRCWRVFRGVLLQACMARRRRRFPEGAQREPAFVG